MEWSSELLVLLPGRAGVVGIGVREAGAPTRQDELRLLEVGCVSLVYRSGEEIVLTPADCIRSLVVPARCLGANSTIFTEIA